MVMVVSDFLAFYNPVCSTSAQYCATSIYDLGCLLKQKLLQTTTALLRLL